MQQSFACLQNGASCCCDAACQTCGSTAEQGALSYNPSSGLTTCRQTATILIKSPQLSPVLMQGYEPYMISARKNVPWYDERFRGHGRDRIVQTLNMAGFVSFAVHPTAYVIQQPHPQYASTHLAKESPKYTEVRLSTACQNGHNPSELCPSALFFVALHICLSVACCNGWHSCECFPTAFSCCCLTGRSAEEVGIWSSVLFMHACTVHMTLTTLDSPVSYPSSYASQHFPSLLLQLIQTYSQIRGSILAGRYEPVSAFSCKQGHTSYTAADLPTRNQVSEAAYAASLASAGRLAALTSQVHCSTSLSWMPWQRYSVSSHCRLKNC